jgi:transcription elongation GreA/GreB family factor
VISPDSPLGKKLMGLKCADAAEVNGATYTIKSVT